MRLTRKQAYGLIRIRDRGPEAWHNGTEFTGAIVRMFRRLAKAGLCTDSPYRITAHGKKAVEDYLQWQEKPRRYAPGTLCRFPNCESEVVSKHLCVLHYSRLRRNGDPAIRTTKPTNIAFADNHRVRFTPSMWAHWWEKRQAPHPEAPVLRAGIADLRQSLDRFASIDQTEAHRR